MRPYIPATCNPDADSWVAGFLAWWIDPGTGLPIPERAGVLPYHIRVSDKIVWADRPEELMQNLPRPRDLPPGFELPRPISVTFRSRPKGPGQVTGPMRRRRSRRCWG